METLRIRGTVKDGILTVQVPEKFEGKEVNVDITDYDVFDHPEDWAKLPGAERVKILEQFKGTAKYPDAETNKYDVYDQ